MESKHVYLAAKYARKEELKKYQKDLEAKERVCTSRWLTETHPPDVKMADLSDLFNRETAIQDLQDINSSDAMVFFAEDQHKQPPRGGRHVEFGYALACGLEIYVIGEKENIFHHLPYVKHYESWAEFAEKEL